MGCCIATGRNSNEVFICEVFDSMKICNHDYIKVKAFIDSFSGITMGNLNTLQEINVSSLKGEEDNISQINEMSYMTLVNSLIDSDKATNPYYRYHTRFFNLMFKIYQNFDSKYIILFSVISFIPDSGKRSNDRVENFTNLILSENFKRSVNYYDLKELFEYYLNFNIMVISFVTYEVSKTDPNVSKKRVESLKKNFEEYCNEGNVKLFHREYIINKISRKMALMSIGKNDKLNFKQLYSILTELREVLTFQFLLNRFMSLYAVEEIDAN